MAASPIPETTARAPRIRVVGLGASAGGLEPLEQFLGHVPATSGLAYVVVQHMDPTHKALLGELLQRATTMPVHEITQMQSIEADAVYVIPPNAELTVSGGAFHLNQPSRPRGMRLPIDVLFCSLAREFGERSIGVVLSGMGSDGTIGLQAIKTQGGLGVVQQPESAQFDSMPKNAIAAGCADVIALPAEMPDKILSIARSAEPNLPRQEPRASPHDPSALDAVLRCLREHTRHDLALYKSNTLIRRIERRMGVHGVDSMAAYAKFLDDNPHEIELLFKEILIGVTAFFRDPIVWQELKDKVLPELLSRRVAEKESQLRAWVAGCSTGEEAYSLAMAFTEVTQALPQYANCRLSIFATDLSTDAIAVARAGHYPATIAGDVTPQRLDRFFTERPGGFQISPSIREMVRFAQHDVILDPPFTRLDILSCRNLLIYFGTALQNRLMPLFHYSLRPGGVLLLGGAETVGRSQTMFRPLHSKSRLYWRSEGGGGARMVYFPSHGRASRTSMQETNLAQPNTHATNVQALVDQLLLQTFSPPAVLVNEGGDIVYISGRTGRYLEPAAGKANWNIHVMARPGIRAQLAVALRSAFLETKTVELRRLKIDDDVPAAVDITVAALQHPKALEGTAIIVFRDAPVEPSRRGRRTKAVGTVDPAISEELIRCQEEIRALRQEMRASQEELQAANEELQSTNEELQSANEELTTSKEEAQSMNEELQTINGELQSKLDDLALAQSDMQNLLNSTDIATLFLDADLNVRRFTDQISRVVHLREGDIGRPLSELATTLDYPELHADVKETLRTLASCEKQISTTDGRWFTVRIMPYRTLTNVIQGVVVTFVDITASKELEFRLRKA